MPVRDLRDQVAVFVSTIGDRENLEDCMSHLRSQSAAFRLEIIDRIAPMSACFQQMQVRCRTPYYVQVDEDMLLAPFAVEALYEVIENSDRDVAIVSAPLWDVDSRRIIHGVKIYRYEIVRGFPYRDALGCDIVQLEQLRAAGYKVQAVSPGGRWACLGEHGKHYTPRTIFIRWQRLLQKHRRYQSLGWAESRVPFLLERYLHDPSAVHLYAFLGAVAGSIGVELPDLEADYREENPEYLRLLGLIGLPESENRKSHAIPQHS